MATIRISDLKLRTIIGVNDWERDILQDLTLNIAMDFDSSKPAQSDELSDTIDYKALTKEIIEMVEDSEFYLLEKLSSSVLDIIMKNKKVEKASVRIDKPGALRFADSVSVELTRER